MKKKKLRCPKCDWPLYDTSNDGDGIAIGLVCENPDCSMLDGPFEWSVEDYDNFKNSKSNKNNK